MLLVAAGVAAGLAVGYASPVTYTAQGQMLAGGTSVDAAAVPAFTQAGESLAQTYSRVLSGDQVQQKLIASGFDPATETIAASPIAGSSVILIEATGPTPAAATRLADVGIAALESTVGSLLDNSTLIADTRAKMLSAFTEQSEAQAAISELDDRDTDKNATVYGEAIARLSAARANGDSLRQLLTQQISGSVAANGVAPLTSASITGSTSLRRFEVGGSIGLVAGIVVWLTISFVRSSGFRRRRPGLRRATGA